MSNDILFKHPDWVIMPQPPSGCECAWRDSSGTVIVLNHLGRDQALRGRMGDVGSARNHYRASFAEEGIGLIECDLFDLDGVRAVRAIGKSIRQPGGATYIGTIALPLPKESYVLNVLARESGITGVRETVVVAEMMNELGKQGFALDLPPDSESGANKAPLIWKNASTGGAVHWMQDPYDSEIQGPCLRNLADAPEYDAKFPQHPLSRVRAALQCLTQGIQFSAELKKRAEEKKWWNFW